MMGDQFIGKRYRIIRKLGEGGMGMVYQAVDERLAREVAVKRLDVFKNGSQHVDEFNQRFQREAKTMAQFNHPNIVNVFDYGQDEEGLYLVIEYMPGGTLEERMGKPMPVREAAALLLPIANALSYVHERGIVHRDIKPANILFDVHNNPMLTDFGIIKLMDSDGGATLTAAGSGVGTPTYMAPEQMTKDFDHRVDQYALGIIFYELVTGRKPYQGDTPLRTLYMHATQALPDPRLYVPDLSQEAYDLIQKALSKNREDRYPSMAFFAHALQHVVAEGEQDDRTQLVSDSDESETMLQTPVILNPETFSTVTAPEPEPQMPAFIPSEPVSAPVVSKKGKKISPFVFVLGCGGLLAVVVLIAVIIFLPRVLKNGARPVETPSEILLELTEMALLPTETEAIPTATTLPTQTTEPVVEEIATNTPIPPTPTEEPQVYVDGTIQTRLDDMMPMVYISEGAFTMGTNDSRVDQRPAHEVWLSAYWMDQYEVTNQQYAGCVEAGACREPVSFESETREEYYDDSTYSNYPVVHVSWSQANNYCLWVGGRLPTEAEWEKAARGTNQRIYPWGDEFPDKTRMNFNNLVGDTTAVGSYPAGASPYGVMDLAGNVREWVLDWYDNEYYQSSPQENPTGPLDGEMRGLRGGAWQSDVNSTRAVYRNMGYPKNSSNHIGFRCVVLP